MDEHVICDKCKHEPVRLCEYYGRFGLILCEDCAWKMSTKEILAFFGIETRVKQ